MENTTLSMVLQLGFALVCVICAILILAWLTKKLNIGVVGQQKHMRILGVLPLSAREKAILIEVAGKQILLGVAPGRVSTLTELSGKELNEMDVDEPGNLGAKTVSEFSKKLQACLGSGKSHEQ